MVDVFSEEFLDSLDIRVNFNLSDLWLGEFADNLSHGGNETDRKYEEQQYEKALLNYYLMGIGGTTVCFVGIVCNILSVIVLTRRVMNSSTYSYLAALAACDTIALFLTVLIFMLSRDTKVPQKEKIMWDKPSYAILFPYLHPAAVTFQVTSIWLTLAFTVDRYIMICHPFKAERMCSVSRARKVIVIIYILGALFNIPRYLEYTTQKIEVPTLTGGAKTEMAVQYTKIGSNQLFRDLVHSYLYLFFVCGIPFLMLAILNIFLIYAVHLSKKKGRMINAREKRRNDTTVMLIGVVLIFLFCQGPALISRMVYAIDFTLGTSSMTFHKINEAGNFLIIVNSAINIVPYYFFGKKFRKEFWRLFCKCFLTKQELRKITRNMSFSFDRRRISQCSAASQYELNGYQQNQEVFTYKIQPHRDSSSPLLKHLENLTPSPNVLPKSEVLNGTKPESPKQECKDSPSSLRVIWEMDDNKNQTCNVKLDLFVNSIEESHTVLKVGVTCTRYVALNLARPWVVHAYRNIKGRGLHAVEEGSDTVPIEECDIPGAEVIDQTDEPPDDQLDEQLEEPVSPHEDKIENLTDVTQVKHHLKGNLDKRKLVTNMAWTGPLSEEQAMRYKTVTEIQLASEGSSKLLETELAIEGRSKQLETDLASEGSSKQLETDLASEGSSKQLESDRVSEGSSKRLQTDMASGHIEKPLVGQEEERHDKVAQVILSGTNKEMAIDLQKIDAQEDFSKTCTKDQGKETDVASQSNNTLEGMEVSCTANRKRTVSKVITDSPTDIEPTSKRVKPSEEIVSSESSHKDNVDVQIINTEPGVPELETAPNPADSKDDACQERDVGASEKTQQAGNARSDEDQPEGTEGEQAASKQKRSLRKRRLSSSKEQTEDSKVQPVSTYDKVRLIIAPWRKPEGGINKPVLKMFLESVVLFLMHKPGADMKSISERYSPYLQPGMLRYLLDILEDIGCITRSYITSSKASLFSKYTPPVQDVYESEGSRMMIIPEADCVVKLGMFGLQFYPSVKWLAYTSTG